MVKIVDALTQRDRKNIEITKSDSETCGQPLRQAHYELGFSLAETINNHHRGIQHFDLLILMRAGLCLGLGIADCLEKLGKIVNIVFSTDNYNIKTNKVVIVDAVINSGNTVIRYANQIQQDVIIAAGVINDQSIKKFDAFETYVVRTSEVFFQGSDNKKVMNGKGPDTSERLYNRDFYEKR